MSRSRAVVITVAASGLLLSGLGASASASKPPRCNKTVGGAVHTAEQLAGRAPVAGSAAAGVVHDVVEPVACSLPV